MRNGSPRSRGLTVIRFSYLMIKDTRPIVAHINRAFFAPSQTFIYSAVRHLRGFRAVCLAEEIVNLGAFPFPRSEMHKIVHPRFSAPGLYSQFRHGGRRMDAELAIRVLRRSGAKCVHAHFGPNGHFALQLRRELNIPVVTSFYGFDLTKLTRGAEWRGKYQELFREGDCFLAEGPCMRAGLEALGCPPEKIRIQRTGIPFSQMDPVPSRPPGDKVVIGFCGRFVEKKGMDLALRALAEVKKEAPHFEFRVVGDGPEKDAVSRSVVRLGLTDHVKMLGFLPYQRYLEELGGADILLQPSITASDGDSEGGAPTVILEAQALGVPVISTTHADIPYVVSPGKSAFLSPEGDVGGLARDIILLMRDPALRKDMGTQGRRFVGSRHDIQKEIVHLESVYGSVIR